MKIVAIPGWLFPSSGQSRKNECFIYVPCLSQICFSKNLSEKSQCGCSSYTVGLRIRKSEFHPSHLPMKLTEWSWVHCNLLLALPTSQDSYEDMGRERHLYASELSMGSSFKEENDKKLLNSQNHFESNDFG